MTTVRRRIPATDGPHRQAASESAGRSPELYVRHARTLRYRHRRNPATLHRALGELNAARPAPPAPSAAPEQTFYAAVEQAFDGPTLRYSQRLALLSLAESLDLSRFRANLVIATAQHRRATAIPPQRRGWLVPVSLGVLLQATILLAAALLLLPRG